MILTIQMQQMQQRLTFQGIYGVFSSTWHLESGLFVLLVDHALIALLKCSLGYP